MHRVQFDSTRSHPKKSSQLLNSKCGRSRSFLARLFVIIIHLSLEIRIAYIYRIFAAAISKLQSHNQLKLMAIFWSIVFFNFGIFQSSNRRRIKIFGNFSRKISKEWNLSVKFRLREKNTSRLVLRNLFRIKS